MTHSSPASAATRRGLEDYWPAASDGRTAIDAVTLARRVRASQPPCVAIGRTHLT